MSEENKSLSFDLYDVRTGGDCLFEALLSFLYLDKKEINYDSNIDLMPNDNLNSSLDYTYSIFQRKRCDGLTKGSESIINKHIMKQPFESNCNAIKDLIKIKEHLCNKNLINNKIKKLLTYDDIGDRYTLNNILNGNTEINEMIKNYYDDNGQIVYGDEVHAMIFGILYNYNVKIYYLFDGNLQYDAIQNERQTFNIETYDNINNFNELYQYKKGKIGNIQIDNPYLLIANDFELRKSFKTIHLLNINQHWIILIPKHNSLMGGKYFNNLFNSVIMIISIIMIIWLINILYKQISSYSKKTNQYLQNKRKIRIYK
jgi:hypothetical protein